LFYGETSKESCQEKEDGTQSRASQESGEVQEEEAIERV